MERQKFQTRKILLRGDSQRNAAAILLANLPLDPERPLELLVREEVRPRKLSQQALMWLGPLKDIEEQAWAAGQKYSAEVWHEHFKREFLPEEYDPELCLEGYRKWDFMPSGRRVLVGSTTHLTVKGFAQYLTQVEAFGASLGVIYSAREVAV